MRGTAPLSPIFGDSRHQFTVIYTIAQWSTSMSLFVPHRARLLQLLICCSAGLLVAQDYRAHVQGTVSDASNAVVTDATVTLRSKDTGVSVARQSDATGHFLFDYVVPGKYSVTVEKQGFNTFKQDDLTVVTRGDISVDAKLTVGQIAQSVEVSAQATTLELNTTTMSQTVGTSMLMNIPTLARNPFTLVLLNPAVVNQYSTLANLNPYYMQAANGMDVGGTTGGRNELLLDGVPIGVGSRGSYAPTMDAVQEVSIQQNSVDAEFGFSMGGVLSVGMKSGTNEYHGTAWYFGRTPGFNAMSNRYTRSASIIRQNDGGFTVGGPVVKNRVFTFFSYEKLDKTEPRDANSTLPTSLERTGDFSSSLNINGALRTIYDPSTTVTNTATNTASRTPFPGNIIPSSQIDASGKVVMGDIWSPNNSGDNITGTNNYKKTYAYWTEYWNLSNRSDFYINNRLRMYTRYSIMRTRLDNDNYANSPAVTSGNGGLMDALNAAADAVYTFSPTSVLNVRFGTTYVEDEFNSDWSKVGESGLEKIWGNNKWYSDYLKGLPAIYYPYVSIAGSTSFGKGSTWFYRPRKYSTSATYSNDRGKHYIKWGGAFRYSYGIALAPNLMEWKFYPVDTSSSYINSNTKLSGDGYASLLLGVVNTGTAKYVVSEDILSNQYGLFFQDDYKLSRNITLNLGIRYEYETAPRERNNRISRFLNLNEPIPEMQSNAPSMPSAVTAMRTSSPIYNGAWVYTDAQNRGLYTAKKTLFLPRVGIAYRLKSKTALRLGYARYALPMTNAIGLGYNIPADGYSVSTTTLSLLEGKPRSFFNDPFPSAGSNANPLTESTGKSLGRYTHLGESATWWQQDAKVATSDRLNLTVQHQLPQRIRLDASYFFAFTHHFQSSNIWGGTNSTDTALNMVDPRLQYTYKAAYSASVANPFYNYMTAKTFPGSLRNQSTVAANQLLRPYPQYTTLTVGNDDRYSNRYQSLQLRGERSFSSGSGFSIAYNYNREATTGYYDDVDKYDNSLLWWGSTNPRHRVTGAGTYEFPVGRGRRWFSRMHPVLDGVLGGWSTSHMVMWNSGKLLSFSGMVANGDPRIDNPTTYKWFDTSVFSVLPSYTRRSNPLYYSGLCGPGFWNWDGTMVKYFPLTNVRENMKIELRLDAFNVSNSFMNGDVATGVTSSNFGKAIGQNSNNLGRSIQYTLRIHF